MNESPPILTEERAEKRQLALDLGAGMILYHPPTMQYEFYSLAKSEDGEREAFVQTGRMDEKVMDQVAGTGALADWMTRAIRFDLQIVIDGDRAFIRTDEQTE